MKLICFNVESDGKSRGRLSRGRLSSEEAGYVSCGCPKLLPEVSQPCQKSESASLDKSSAGDPFDEGGREGSL